MSIDDHLDVLLTAWLLSLRRPNDALLYDCQKRDAKFVESLLLGKEECLISTFRINNA